MGILPGELCKLWEAPTKLKKLTSKKRQAIRAIYAAEYTSEKKEEMKVLNIYKLNIYQELTFMFKIRRDSLPAPF